MNELFEKLARQSGALPTQDCGVPQWYIDEDEFEKFAELIVRECAGIVREIFVTGPNTASIVLEHFGLKDEDE